MSEPTVTCELCGRSQVVKPDGRGFPPDIAKRKLARICNAAGCPSQPSYRAGIVTASRVTGQAGETL
jgi:hypothetical protein